LTAYTFSKKAIYRRFMASPSRAAKWMNFMRAVSSEGHGRLRFYREVRKRLAEDRLFRQYFEGESKQLPAFYQNIIQKDLGIWWQWLPNGAVEHNPNAYLHKKNSASMVV
ncbi:MAG: radical SAM protein, partial [Bacteroidota bacterium]|nr:radical SAM protein [Bacteroidota bacterium]